MPHYDVSSNTNRPLSTSPGVGWLSAGATVLVMGEEGMPRQLAVIDGVPQHPNTWYRLMLSNGSLIKMRRTSLSPPHIHSSPTPQSKNHALAGGSNNHSPVNGTGKLTKIQAAELLLALKSSAENRATVV